MFTSIRSRLWLSYALVITVSLTVVALVLLIFLIRNPVLSRQTQQQLRTVLNTITASSERFLADSAELQRLAETHAVRILVFNSSRQLWLDTQANEPSLPFPRRNLLNRTSQTAIDANGNAWLYSAARLGDGQVLVVAAPRPRVPVLNIFADEFLSPILQGGLIALLLSLILAFALARWVADPLQNVIVAASQYPSDQIKPVKVSGPHEVQTLTHAFNSMLARVQATQQSQKDFVANISHEMKTPLTSIQGFAQAILDDTADTPEARQRAAQIIYEESTRIHRMSLDLLELARLEAGTADLDMSLVDVGALLQGVVEKFAPQVRPQAQNAGVELVVDASQDLPSIIADGDRLAQVLTNLVDNALKFTPTPGRVRLTAKKAGDEIELSVADTGIGVVSDALPRLFDRFYQADPARASGERHGAGLGLAIVKEIIQAHGGKIGVRSQVGSGTTFTIHLPLQK